jgi:hypothetical protein
MADNLFGDLERQYGLPAGYLARTYQIESGSGANLYNPLSKAAGGFQFIPSTAKQYGLKDPYDLAQSAEAAARLAADNRASLQKAGIESPTAAQLYLAHQQGASGANKLLGGADTKATDIVGEKAVLWNAGKASMTGPEFAERIMAKFEGTTPAVQAPVNYTAPWSNAVSALGDVDQRYLGGGLGLLQKQASNLLNMVTPEGSASLPAAAPSPIGFTEPGQRYGANLPQSLMGPPQPAGGVGPYATAGGGQAAMAAVPLAPKDTGFSIDNMTAGQAAGFAGLGNALIAAGAPKMTWKPSGEAAPAFRGQWRDDIFAGLLGPRAWG